MSQPAGHISLRKRLKSTPAWRGAKLGLKRLVGRELRVRPEVRVPSQTYDCWHLATGLLKPGSVMYSLGVCDDISFDLKVISQHGVIVHAFDPTPHAVAWVGQQDTPAGFHFHPWAVTGADGTLRMYPREKRNGTISTVMWTCVPGNDNQQQAIEAPAWCIASLMRQLGHQQVDVLKMDVEGAEYDIIDSIAGMAERPGQVLVEFHHRFPQIGKQKTVAALATLHDAGYRVFAVSDTGREISFVRQDRL